MAPVFRHVPLTEIALDDHTFIVTYSPQMQGLRRSVAHVGVLTPLHLRQTSEQALLQVVCGSKRLLACQQTGRTSVPASGVQRRRTPRAASISIRSARQPGLSYPQRCRERPYPPASCSILATNLTRCSGSSASYWTCHHGLKLWKPMAGWPSWRTLYKLLSWRAPCLWRRLCGLVHMPQRTVRRCSNSSLVSKLAPIGHENLSHISTRYASATPAPRLASCKRSLCQPCLQRLSFPVHRSSRGCASCCARHGIRSSAPTSSVFRRPCGGCDCHPKSVCVHHRTSRASSTR